ncbi:MAG: cadherin domain-containing protein, partial [Planctomycetaceae bacterium]
MLFSRVRHWVTESLRPLSPRSSRRPKWATIATQGLEQRLLLAGEIYEFIDPHPAAGNGFGTHVVPLSTGNVVITSPYDDAGGTNAGAVYLFNGSTGALISTLRGSHANDNVGVGGITTLANGNFVIKSYFWNSGTSANAGAVTWGSGSTGVSGVVSSTNSLVGSTDFDYAGRGGVVALTNGNYVVISDQWNNGSFDMSGAVTWGNGTSGVVGVIGATNSLVGTDSNDQVGTGGVTALPNGNYVVNSHYWNNGSTYQVGAVTLGNGATGTTGAVSPANSLVGSTSYDYVGYSGITVLANGNYVVGSSSWDNGSISDAGAVTWVNASTGLTGTVSSANSLMGNHNFDDIGYDGITALANGNYVVLSTGWDNGTATDAGAVTWGSGTAGAKGVVGSANSLVGTRANDGVGKSGLLLLPSGNYLVRSPYWDNGSAVDAGAVTWGNGTAGVKGAVSASNSLVGSRADDYLGLEEITILTNGNYVVQNFRWDNGSNADAGAVTWGSGTAGVKGAVSSSNSLIGSHANDYVGYGGITPLTNGNYVVNSPDWDSSTLTDAGAVTWGDGTTGVKGTISASNSLVGASDYDAVGYGNVTALTNGNYVVSSYYWDNGVFSDAGAVTWGNGATGTAGAVSTSNSLYGTSYFDMVGYSGITALTNGNYVVASHNWGGDISDGYGAVTLGNGVTGSTGAVSATNSLIGGTTSHFVGFGGVAALTNGNYVVLSPEWDNGAITNVGAATWVNGTTGLVGVVNASNSLIGKKAGDEVGTRDSVTPLVNGNYVIRSPHWDNGAAVDAGAVTWGGGTAGVSGEVSASNSLVGSSSQDKVGQDGGIGGITALSNGNYIVNSYFWNFGSAVDAGAVTWGSGTRGVSGTVNLSNSLAGLSGNTDLKPTAFDYVNNNYFGIFPAEGSDRGRVRVGSLQGHYPTELGLRGTEVEQNAANGTTIGTLTGSDPDAGDPLTFSLVDNAGGRFAISGNELVVANGSLLNQAANPSHDITIRVTDSGGLTRDQVFTITVTSSNPGPTFPGLPQTVNLAENSTHGTVVATVTASDPGDTLTYSITAGNSLGVFSINNSGVITVANNGWLDFESNPTFTLTIQATDSANQAASTTVTVNLIDQVEYAFIKGTLTVYGTSRNDTITIRSSSGFIRIDANGSQSLTTIPASSTPQINVNGGDGNDTITIDSSVNATIPTFLYGEGGNDTLTGGLGSDRLFGGIGNDLLNGKAGADSLNGEDGDDSLMIDNLDTSVIGGIGNDKVTVSGATGPISLNLTTSQIETVSASTSIFNNLFDATGATWSVNITGGSGNDTLIGGDLNDTLTGGAGNDSLSGGSGNDTLTGGLGADAFDGGEGNDSLTIDNLDTSVVGGVGLDKVTVSGATGGVTLNLTAGQIETVLASSSTFNNTFDATGATWAVSITGGSGNDTISGGNLNDTLTGGAGNDSLVGNGGNDTLTGGLGADAFDGGEGNDSLTIDNLDTSVVGGAGLDKVTVSGATGGVTLNLTAGQIETVL